MTQDGPELVEIRRAVAATINLVIALAVVAATVLGPWWGAPELEPVTPVRPGTCVSPAPTLSPAPSADACR